MFIIHNTGVDVNRINRITAILIQLQSRKVVRAQDIAKRFGISLRTVYRDIKMLEEAGVPIMSEAGVGYSIMDGYRLPPVMFTKEEATAFLTAEKLVEKLTDSATAEQYTSAMFKVKAVLRTAEKELLEQLDRHIHVAPHPLSLENEHAPARNLMQPIIKSIAEKKVLSLHYVARYNGVSSRRDVEPIGICLMNGHWHLIAFCRLRHDYRDFRLDRIAHLQPAELAIGSRELTLDGYLQRLSRKEHLTQIVVVFSRSVLQYIAEQKYYYGFVSEQDTGDTIEMTFLTHSTEGIARWLLMFGRAVTIVSSPALLDRMRELARDLGQQYG